MSDSSMGGAFNSDPFELHFRNGRQFFSVRSYDRAVQELEAALALDPGHTGARIYLAHCWVRLDKLDKASREVGIALKSEPNNAEAHYLAAFSTLKWKTALQSIDIAISLEPRKSEYHQHRCYVLTRLNRYKEAFESGRKALELAPNSPGNHRQMANSIFDKAMPKGYFGNNSGLSHAEHEEAAFHVARALELDPENALSQSIKARLNAFNLEHEEALQGWHESLRLNPNEKYAQHNLLIAKRQVQNARFQEKCWRICFRWMPWPIRLPLAWSLMAVSFWWGMVRQPGEAFMSGNPAPFIVIWLFGALQTPLLLRDWLRFVPDRYLGRQLRPLKKPPLK